MTTQLVLLIVGILGGATGREVVVRMFDRGRQQALSARARVDANAIVRESYEELIEELRRDAASARTEARDARHEAREATRRAGEAEQVAASASASAARADLALAEVRRLVMEHVPDSEDLLRQIERVTGRRS